MEYKKYILCPRSSCGHRNILNQEMIPRKCEKCGRLLKDQPICLYTEEIEQTDTQESFERQNNDEKCEQREPKCFQLNGKKRDGEEHFVIHITPQADGYFSIGRQEQEELSSPYISRLHATIRIIEDQRGGSFQFRIWDHSTNRTLVNGSLIPTYERAQIKTTEGERLQLGDVITLDANRKEVELILQQR